MNDTRPSAELALRCREETARYLRHEPYAEHFCLELFRQALQHHDDVAWTALYQQYADLVRRWLDAPPQDADADVGAVFARFWHAVDADRFARFGSLGAVLQYLKMCAQSVRMDRARTAHARAVEEQLDDAIHALPARDDVAALVDGRLDGAALWRAVQEHLPDERERLVIYLSYAIGLPPREICARHAARFPDVAEVYRLKRRALDRLRHTPALQALQ